MKISWTTIFLGLLSSFFAINLSAEDLVSLLPNGDIDSTRPVQLATFEHGDLTLQDVNCNDNACDACADTWRSNLQAWAGGSSFKSIGDTLVPPGFQAGYQENAGLVGGLNTSFGLGDRQVRAQIGGSYGVYDIKGRDSGFAKNSSLEQQSFITAGFYKRGDIAQSDRISWGVVYDQLFDHQYGMRADELYLSQIRGLFGYALNCRNEVGVWGTVRTNTDTIQGIPDVTAGTRVFAANQINSYWRHLYDCGGTTTAYIGFYDRSNISSWSLGFNGTAPLNNHLGLYGNFAFAFPSSATGIVGSDELQWFSGFGLVYYFGGKSYSSTITGNRTAPLLPVADPSMLQVTY